MTKTLTRFPRIETAFDTSTEQSNQFFYQALVENILRKILPIEVLEDGDQKIFEEALPLISSIDAERVPADLSFFCVLKSRPNAFKFFYEMITHWLIPGERLNVSLVYAVDFKLPDLSDQTYCLCEVLIRVEEQEKLETIKANFPSISSELRLGLPYAYHARRILEIRGLTADEKTALIQDYIGRLIQKVPSLFDRDVLGEMQHMLVICRDQFKMERSARHLGRLISTQYLFRRAIQKTITEELNKRHVIVKLIKTEIKHNQESKPVLGIVVGLNFLKEKEIFEERHLVYALQHLIPEAKAVKGSILSHRREHEQIITFYLEIEKESGEAFTSTEMKLLRDELPTDLQTRVGCLMHPLFMPRNEEEVMRNVLTLSSQIKYIRDIPQVCINFEEQTISSLSFTVVLVRIVPPGSHSIEELFKSSETTLEYIQDRCKTLGFLRGKYAKEATVFRIKLPKDKFIRKDHSIDLYKARQEVVLALLQAVGEFRDFNGGMISKQHELLAEVRLRLKGVAKRQELLLENFFYSLTPVVMRTVLEPEALSHLFTLLLQSILVTFSADKDYYENIDVTENFAYVVIKCENRAIKEIVVQAIAELHIPSTQLAAGHVIVHDQHYLSYIYRSDEHEAQQQFVTAIIDGLATWHESQVAEEAT